MYISILSILIKNKSENLIHGRYKSFRTQISFITQDSDSKSFY